jgi:hypothetical protein
MLCLCDIASCGDVYSSRCCIAQSLASSTFDVGSTTYPADAFDSENDLVFPFFTTGSCLYFHT